MSAYDSLCVALSKLFDFRGNGEQEELTGYDGLNSIREFFPLFLVEGEIRSEIQQGALSWASLGTDGFDEFVGEVTLAVLIIGMRCFPDEHATRISSCGDGVNIGCDHDVKFWHYVDFLSELKC